MIAAISFSPTSPFRNLQPLTTHAHLIKRSTSRSVLRVEFQNDLLRGICLHLHLQQRFSGSAVVLPSSSPATASGMEGINNKKRVVFVTVGTTLFDALVRAVDSHNVRQELAGKGYTHLLIQMGRGSYVPTKSEGDDGSLAVDYFTFSSSIADYLKSASLVISHAGSGSIFETLRLGKPLIVVVNEDLMDNHQSELAEELADRKHLYCARPQTLHQTIANMDLNTLLPYSPGDATPVAKHINRFLGFPDDD